MYCYVLNRHLTIFLVSLSTICLGLCDSNVGTVIRFNAVNSSLPTRGSSMQLVLCNRRCCIRHNQSPIRETKGTVRTTWARATARTL